MIKGEIMNIGCDTVVALPNTTKGGQTIFAKNSDRPKEECQPLVQINRQGHPYGTMVRCRYIELPQVNTTYCHVGSKPYWCWGYEHGFNEHQVVIGNVGLWSKIPEFQEPKLLGMEILRLGLERSRTAAEAIEVMTTLITKYGQGSFKNDDSILTYDNGYIIADPFEAYVIETAGHEWVVKKVESTIGISNIYSIGIDWDRLSPSAEDNACKQGWWKRESGRFNFAKAYGDNPYPSRFPVDPKGTQRKGRSCEILNQYAGEVEIGTIFSLLRDHENGEVAESLFRAEHHSFGSICMHSSSFDDPNFAIVTAASLVADLCSDGSRLPVYWCSFYSPCLSVFQPIFIEGQIPPILSLGGAEFDAKSLWWLFRMLESVVRKDTTGDTGKAVRTTWQKFEEEFKITAYEIAEEAKKTFHAGQCEQASRMLTEYMNHNLDKVLSALRGFLSKALKQYLWR